MELSDNYTVFKNMWNMGDNSMPCTKVYHFQHLCSLMEQYTMWCVKVKLSLYLPWRHSRSGGTAPLILNLNKSKGEWAGSYPSWFLPIIRWTRDWVGPTAFSVRLREEEYLLSRPGNETQTTQPTACLFTALTTLSWLNLHDPYLTLKQTAGVRYLYVFLLTASSGTKDWKALKWHCSTAW
jgi:hypothetical protein